jgi:hypothetical protein
MNDVFTKLSNKMRDVKQFDSRIIIFIVMIKTYIMNCHLINYNTTAARESIVSELMILLTDHSLTPEISALFSNYIKCITNGHCARIGEYEFCSNAVSSGRLVCDECTTYSTIPSNPIEISEIIADYTGY